MTFAIVRPFVCWLAGGLNQLARYVSSVAEMNSPAQMTLSDGSSPMDEIEKDLESLRVDAGNIASAPTPLRLAALQLMALTLIVRALIVIGRRP
jgi:hypothetical protein